MGTHYSHVTLADRMSIQALLQAKLSGPAIARKLNCSRSTIHREINRSKATPTALASAYQAGVAQVRTQAKVVPAPPRAASWDRTRLRPCGVRWWAVCVAAGRLSRSQANCLA